MTFKFFKLRSSYNKQLFLCACLKISIANVCSPELQLVHLCQEHNQAQTSERHNSRVDSLNRFLGEMSICNKPCFAPSIMFDIKNKVYPYFLMSFWWILEFPTLPNCLAKVLEDLILLDLIQFKVTRILPPYLMTCCTPFTFLNQFVGCKMDDLLKHQGRVHQEEKVQKRHGQCALMYVQAQSHCPLHH